MRGTLVLTLLILPALTAAAQNPSRANPVEDPSIGVIVYAEGETITILRAGRPRRLNAGLGEPLGEPLLPGDQVSTSEDTYAEIQLLTSRNIVKVAENTTFVVAELTGGGDSALSVTYGRLRARVDRLTGNDRFEVRGMTSVAGVRGTDFGYDQVLDPVTGQLVSRVYCFEGSVSVTSTVVPEQQATIEAGEMIAAPVEAPPEQIEVVSIDKPIASFWEARPFRREPREIREIIDEFPALPLRSSNELGAVPSVLESAIAAAEQQEPSDSTEQATPEEPETAVTDSVEVTEISPSQDDEAPEREQEGLAEMILGDADTPELREQIAGGLRTTGYWVTGLGVAVDVVAVGLVFVGDDLPFWDPAYEPWLGPAGAGGVGMVALGAGLIVLSLAFSN